MAKRTETSKLRSKLKKSAKIEKNEKFYVYSIWLEDTCVYVGSTNDIERRWRQHKEDLMYGRHTNKTLQKIYNDSPRFTYKIEMECPVDNDLLKFFCEFIFNSLRTPKSNKCVLQQGRKMICLPRLKDKNLAQLIINTINNYYKEEVGQ